jgi:hypothetical protein
VKIDIIQLILGRLNSYNKRKAKSGDTKHGNIFNEKPIIMFITPFVICVLLGYFLFHNLMQGILYGIGSGMGTCMAKRHEKRKEKRKQEETEKNTKTNNR